MEDEKIISALEEFGLFVANKRVYENELDNNYNYFVFRRGSLSSSGCSRYVRTIQIAYVYHGEQTISDFDIINKIEKLGLNFSQMDNQDYQLADTNEWVDVNMFTFTRPEKG